MISHDRYFLDKVVQRSIEINEGKAEFYSGHTTAFTSRSGSAALRRS